MKLSSEVLRKIYRNTDSLNEFLSVCSHCYYDPEYCINPPFGISMNSIEDLPERELIELFEWWKKKHSEQKYTIQIFPNSFGYLNISNDGSKADVGGLTEYRGWHMTFTKSEIEQLKQRDDIAIDWDKAKIEPLEEQE